MNSAALDEVERLVSTYVDRYRDVDRYDRIAAELSERLAAVNADRALASDARDAAEDALNEFISDIEDEREVAEVMSVIEGKLSSIIGLMVM